MSEVDASADTARDEMIANFVQISGATEENARNLLEACAWNMELALNMQMDTQSHEAPSSSSRPIANLPSAPVNPNQPSSSSSNSVGIDEDYVRPPIAPVRQVLVEDFSSYVPLTRNVTRGVAHGVFDQMRNFQAEARWREQELLSAAEAELDNESNSEKRKTLEELFRPPLDLMFQGSMDLAKEAGSKQNKWLMVNVQDSSEFACQVLNRDCWSNPAVKTIVNEHFIFWQVYKNSNEGQRYMQFYPFDKFPYVAVLDPRTGELIRSWNTITDSQTFCDFITEFLQDHPSPDGSIGTLPQIITNHATATVVEPRASSAGIFEESEEEQLKRAIQASLQDVKQSPTFDIDDGSDFETFPDSDDEVNVISNGESKPLETQELKDVEVVEAKDEDKDWTKYLGSGADYEFRITYPDGQRETMKFPSDSKLKALFLYLESKGYSLVEFDIVTNFPRKNVHELSAEETLVGAGFSAREALIVQHKT